MKKPVLVLAALAAVTGASVESADAQMWFFPDYAVPTSFDIPNGFVAATYGRGLNENSQEADAFGVAFGRAFESGGFMGSVGIVSNEGESEPTLGIAGALDVTSSESSAISVHGGVGWMGPGDATFLRLPVGLAFRTRIDSGEAIVTPWIMPRINIVHLSGSGFTNSDTQTDFATSGGVAFNFPSGIGVHTALDFWTGEGESAWTFGAGVHVLVGGG